MAYARRFKSKAKEELDQTCECYGDSFREDLYQWLNRLVVSTGSAADNTLDVTTALEHVLQASRKSWKLSAKQFWKASAGGKMQALFHTLRKWSPPFEIRFASEWFNVIGRFDCEIHVYFLVDHVKKEVIFAKFDGLPGQ